MSFRSYPYKHYESVFTRFYQGYLLPRKFGVDKRRLHLSTLIISGEMSREEAESYLGQEAYPMASDREADIKYFLKKMKWTSEKLDAYLSRPSRSHGDFPTDRYIAQWALRTRSLLPGK